MKGNLPRQTRQNIRRLAFWLRCGALGLWGSIVAFFVLLVLWLLSSSRIFFILREFQYEYGTGFIILGIICLIWFIGMLAYLGDALFQASKNLTASTQQSVDTGLGKGFEYINRFWYSFNIMISCFLLIILICTVLLVL